MIDQFCFKQSCSEMIDQFVLHEKRFFDLTFYCRAMIFAATSASLAFVVFLTSQFPGHVTHVITSFLFH